MQRSHTALVTPAPAVYFPLLMRGGAQGLASTHIVTWNVADETIERNRFGIATTWRQILVGHWPLKMLPLIYANWWPMRVICLLRVSLVLKLGFMPTVSVVTKAAGRRIGLEGCDGLTCQPQPELEDIALSRWEWTNLWQPVSKWQNPSFRIDQLLFFLSTGIFRPSSRLFFPVLWHLPLPTCPAAPYWSSLVIGWTVIWDGHWRMSAKCFSFFLFLSAQGWWSHNASDSTRVEPIAMECRPD